MFLSLFLNYFFRYYLIPAVIAQLFNHITVIAIPIRIRTKEAKAEI